jgi:hypothetical protein
MFWRECRASVWGFAAALLAALALLTAARAGDSVYRIRADHWTKADEDDYSRFIAAIGESDCATLNDCLHGAANPFAASDPPERKFESDCADLPYVLRFYFAWKRGLPFSYASAVAPRDGAREDIRYSHAGNKVTGRTDILSGENAMTAIGRIRADISTATYRIHPDLDGTDLYSPAIKPGAIRPGTVIYDPAGHVAIVYRVDPDGRVHSFDAHTDFSLTTMTFDVRFARMRPAQGAGFKDWRPVRLALYQRAADGTLTGGHADVAHNTAIADFSTEQFFGTGPRPADAAWANGQFHDGGETLDFYDFVRARLAGGKLVFDPVRETGEMTTSLCNDLQYRAAAVDRSRALAAKPHPARLPRNIYGTDGDWEMFSTPSRDARLKTAFKYLRDMVQRFVDMDRSGDHKHLSYTGSDLTGDLLNAYNRAANACTIRYRRSDGSTMALSFEAARQRLFQMSFDPYHCPERRWGATEVGELATCRDGEDKRAWYGAEQGLRNQIDRTYDERMDFTLADLRSGRQGMAGPPDTNIKGYLEQAAHTGD